MKLVSRLGAVAAALLLASTPQAPADELDDLAGQIAGRSAALSQLLGRLSSPETARTLIDSAVTGDPRAFNQLFEGIEIPLEHKCFWVTQLVEKLTSTPAGFVEECWLRDDLTTQEFFLYMRIAMRHGQVSAVGKGTGSLTVLTDASGHTLIPAGAFLDELMANGLVTCKLVMKYNSGTSLVFEKPERFCLQLP